MISGYYTHNTNTLMEKIDKLSLGGWRIVGDTLRHYGDKGNNVAPHFIEIAISKANQGVHLEDKTLTNILYHLDKDDLIVLGTVPAKFVHKLLVKVNKLSTEVRADFVRNSLNDFWG